MALNQFNDLADFTVAEVEALLRLAARLQQRPEPHALAGKVLALLFLSPSLRTLASFQAAMVRLGGGSFVISPDMSIHGLETRSGIVMDGVAAEKVAAQMRKAVCAMGIEHRDSRLGQIVTISIGVAVVEPSPERRARGALQLADEALYQAKTMGRNRVEVMDPAAHKALETGVFTKGTGPR